jgi:hypothetical protein
LKTNPTQKESVSDVTTKNSDCVNLSEESRTRTKNKKNKYKEEGGLAGERSVELRRKGNKNTVGKEILFFSVPMFPSSSASNDH